MLLYNIPGAAVSRRQHPGRDAHQRTPQRHQEQRPGAQGTSAVCGLTSAACACGADLTYLLVAGGDQEVRAHRSDH